MRGFTSGRLSCTCVRAATAAGGTGVSHERQQLPRRGLCPLTALLGTGRARRVLAPGDVFPRRSPSASWLRGQARNVQSERNRTKASAKQRGRYQLTFGRTRHRTEQGCLTDIHRAENLRRITRPGSRGAVMLSARRGDWPSADLRGWGPRSGGRTERHRLGAPPLTSHDPRGHVQDQG
ncbi:uncharacterized protein LOC109498462 isoform X2 [Felis catus]|nr:uncharacterized protein LOC109498462 isoform X2 [Felis catus]